MYSLFVCVFTLTSEFYTFMCVCVDLSPNCFNLKNSHWQHFFFKDLLGLFERQSYGDKWSK